MNFGTLLARTCWMAEFKQNTKWATVIIVHIQQLYVIIIFIVYVTILLCNKKPKYSLIHTEMLRSKSVPQTIQRAHVSVVRSVIDATVNDEQPTTDAKTLCYENENLVFVFILFLFSNCWKSWSFVVLTSNWISFYVIFWHKMYKTLLLCRL